MKMLNPSVFLLTALFFISSAKAESILSNPDILIMKNSIDDVEQAIADWKNGESSKSNDERFLSNVQSATIRFFQSYRTVSANNPLQDAKNQVLKNAAETMKNEFQKNLMNGGQIELPHIDNKPSSPAEVAYHLNTPTSTGIATDSIIDSSSAAASKGNNTSPTTPNTLQEAFMVIQRAQEQIQSSKAR